VSLVRQARLAVVVVVLATSAFALYPAASSSGRAGDKEAQGRQLYRKFCGQCHALAPAHAAGFGSAKKGGLGDLGGPSFNQLNVPYKFSISAVTEPSGGHELVKKRITTRELHQVAQYIAKTTSHHPVPAFPTDG